MNSRLASSTSRASVDLPEPLTPVIATSRFSGMSTVTSCRLCSVAPCTVSSALVALSLRSVAAVTSATGRRGCSGCTSGCARKRPVTESCIDEISVTLPCATSLPPRFPAPGPMSMMWSARRIVSSSCSTTTSVLPLLARFSSASSRMRVVARVQADRRLVEHVAHALQIRAELRRQADALRLAARKRGRGAVERQVAEAHLLQELEAAPDLGDDVARDLGVAAGERQRLDPLARVAHRPLRDPGDRLLLEGDLARHLVQARAGALGAGLVDDALDLVFLAREGLLAAAVVVARLESS